jgi:hypothetical protein
MAPGFSTASRAWPRPARGIEENGEAEVDMAGCGAPGVDVQRQREVGVQRGLGEAEVRFDAIMDGAGS